MLMYLEKYQLEDKVVVINGGARGIGYACAEAFAECGATLVLSDIIPEVESSAQQLREEKQVEATAHIVDLTSTSQVNAMAATIQQLHQKVDVVVNSQGIGGAGQVSESLQDESWNKTMSINLDSVFWCCRVFGNIMFRHGTGSIVNLGSMSGIVVNNGFTQAAYNASKAAVHQLTRSLAVEWARKGVRVNAVAPTYIATEMTRGATQKPDILARMKEATPQNRIGEPHEIASAVLFLGSDASSLMTGSVLVVDGGFTCW